MCTRGVAVGAHQITSQYLFHNPLGASVPGDQSLDRNRASRGVSPFTPPPNVIELHHVKREMALAIHTGILRFVDLEPCEPLGFPPPMPGFLIAVGLALDNEIPSL